MNRQEGNLNSNSEANLHAIDYWQVLRNRYGIIILATLLIFATAAIITYVIPEKYKSECVIEVHNPLNELDPFNSAMGQQLTGAMMSRNFMQTQFELITSELVLTVAAKNLDLPSRWNIPMEDAVQVLKGITNTEQRRGTDLIEITVEYKHAEEAREIASAVALAYMQQRQEMELGRSEKALDALDSELQDQEDLVQERRNALNTIVQTTGQTYVEDGKSNSAMGDLEATIYSQGRMNLEDLDKSRRSLRSQISTLTGKTDDELIASAAGLDIVDSRVPRLYEQFVTSQRDLVGLQSSGLGQRHPRMIAATTTHKTLFQDLQVAVSELRDILVARLELVEADLKEQQTVVTERKDDAIKKAMSSHDFAEARRAYEQEKALFETMKLQLATKRIGLKMPKNTITVYENAKKPKRASFPNVKLNLAIGGVLGLIIGIGLAFTLELIDTSVKSLDDVERYLQVPVLAVIPKDIAMLHKEGGNSPDAEAYRILRTNIEFNRKNPTDNCITVVSGGAGEGKSTTLVNLSYVCARGGYNTLIIDADLRRPRLHTFFDINNSVGLSNYLTTDLTLEDVVLQTPVENLYFMPSGVVPMDAAGILNSSRMSELIADVKDRFDLVLIDSPPILGVSDASVISSEADQTMIVVQHRKLPRNILMRVKQAVENVGGQIIGVVLNNVDIRSDSQYQYYTSYYTYYASTDGSETLAEPEVPLEVKPKQRGAKGAKSGEQKHPTHRRTKVSEEEDSLY